MMFRVSFLFLLLFADLASGQDKYPRGRVEPPKAELEAMHRRMADRHGFRVASLPKATPAKYDCRDFGYVPTVGDQGSCGSCYWWSGLDTCGMAMMKVGTLPMASGGLSKQWGLDCHREQGGCDGGWPAKIIELCRTEGVPTTADYAPYEGRERQCRLKAGTKRYKIADWGFCTPGQESGPSKVQDIKNAMVRYGPIGVDVPASGMDDYKGGVFKTNSMRVDHALIFVGWDDDKQAWLMRNTWSKAWGIDGYMWYAYSNYSIEHIWVSVGELPPAPQPDPTPTPEPEPLPPGPLPSGDRITITLDGKVRTFELFPEGTRGKMDALYKALEAFRVPAPKAPAPKSKAKADTFLDDFANDYNERLRLTGSEDYKRLLDEVKADWRKK